MKRLILIVAGAAALAVMEVAARPVPATPFADNMVLQRGRQVPVWGTAEPGEKVTVSFAGQTKVAAADAKGLWRVELGAMDASKESRTLRVTGADGAEEIKNVLVGEVWFASGQSNMECPIWGGATRYRDGKGAMMIAMTRRPYIRFAKNPRKWSVVPRLGWKAEWRDFSPESFDAVAKGSLSAVAFYYALELYGALDIPIGIVDSSWGGTNIDAWTPHSGYERRPELKDVADYPVREKWDESMRKGPVSGAHQQPSVLWNGMVAAWAPMAIRGMIWYQGCHNNGEPQRYCSKMHALYDGWAKEFQNPCLKLYFVQLAPWRKSWFDLQMAQAKFAAEEPNAAFVTTCDVGNSHDIHPNDKEIVARRLALHALKRDYGFDNIIDDAPTVKSWKVEGGKFVLTFENAQSLYCYNADRSEPKGFEVAGDDGKFFPAKVLNENANSSIKGAELIVGADEVPEPKQLRYLYSKPWIGSLYSADSALPLSPFELKGENER